MPAAILGYIAMYDPRLYSYTCGLAPRDIVVDESDVEEKKRSLVDLGCVTQGVDCVCQVVFWRGEILELVCWARQMWSCVLVE